jgi:hypothetical protein
MTSPGSSRFREILRGHYYALLAHQAREKQWEDAGGAASTLRPETEGKTQPYA